MMANFDIKSTSVLKLRFLTQKLWFRDFSLQKRFFCGIKRWNRHSKNNHQTVLLFYPKTNWPIRVIEYESSNQIYMLLFLGQSYYRHLQC